MFLPLFKHLNIYIIILMTFDGFIAFIFSLFFSRRFLIGFFFVCFERQKNLDSKKKKKFLEVGRKWYKNNNKKSYLFVFFFRLCTLYRLILMGFFCGEMKNGSIHNCGSLSTVWNWHINDYVIFVNEWRNRWNVERVIEARVPHSDAGIIESSTF